MNCDTQQELEGYWEKLGAGGEVQLCGWLTDRYGATWQVVPSILAELLLDANCDTSQRIMEAMLQMKKLDIAALCDARGQA